MRSGCSLTSTVLLLLFLGLATWAARHWKPSLICDTAGLEWFCTGYADVTGGTSSQGGDEIAKRGSEAVSESSSAGGSKTVAHPFPWPVADQPRTWSNFREGAYSVPSTAVADVAATSLPWPIADKPIAWSNFRDGAYSVPSTAVADVAATSLPWPIADKPIAWSNFRDGVYADGAAAAPEAGTGKTVAHPFPWPIADQPVKWNNFRKAASQKKIVAKKPLHKTVAHPFPWPVADAPRKWTNVRSAPSAEPTATGVAHPFPWPVADAPRKWTNFRTPPARTASDCGAELNRVAKSGTILFETASAKLTSSSYATLDELARVAKTCDRVRIIVEGHTDDRGSASFNQRLSEQRAQSVAAYLKGAGISGDSLSAVGFGESRPAVANDTAANQAKNRRIEFSVSGS